MLVFASSEILVITSEWADMPLAVPRSRRVTSESGFPRSGRPARICG
jgi:hypothetical protein